MEEEIPLVWRESFGSFSDDSLHLFARLYLGNNGLKKAHSRELIIESLWHCAHREEYNRKSLLELSPFDTHLLLLLYLGLRNIQQLAENLRGEYSLIEICLQLLHLQERMLVLHVPRKNTGRETRDDFVHLIPKIEKQLQGGPEGAGFIIAPQFMEQLQQRLNFCTLFHGFVLPERKLREDSPHLLLSPELLLAGSLFFAQKKTAKGSPSKGAASRATLKRKMNKTLLAKSRECFPQLDEEQLQQLYHFCLSSGLLCEREQSQTLFSVEVFQRLWKGTYYQRFMSQQARISGLSQEVFAKLLSIWPRNILLPPSQLKRLLSLMGQQLNSIERMLQWHILLEAPAPQEGSPEPELPHYHLNPKLYDIVMGTDISPARGNRLDSNWDLYCDLRHPEHYMDLLLCARLECFGELSLFRIEKGMFQQYFNGESSKFERFLQHLPQLERSGIHVSEFIHHQWQEWF
ncbi:MAG: hypothetical protein AAF975_01475, partial [Spirochaetota bacterium]